MAFMDTIETIGGTWYVVDGDHGTDYIPEEVCGSIDGLESNGASIDDDSEHFAAAVKQLRDYIENGAVYEIEARAMWGARYTAPGYMDCTEWTMGETEEEAVKELKEIYGSEDEDEEKPVW